MLAQEVRFRLETKLTPALVNLLERRREVENIFDDRTLDGNLGMSVHRNFWLDEEQADGTIDQSGDAVPERRSLASNEYRDLVRDTMGVGFAMTTISDRMSNRTTGGLNDNLDRLRNSATKYDNQANTSLIRNSLQIDGAHHEGQIGILLYSQKHFLLKGKAENVIEHQKSGLRVFQLCYSRTTQGNLNASNSERLGAGGYDDINADPYAGNYGLTPLGQSVVRQLVDHHVLIDASHTHNRQLWRPLR